MNSRIHAKLGYRPQPLNTYQVAIIENWGHDVHAVRNALQSWIFKIANTKRDRSLFLRWQEVLTERAERVLKDNIRREMDGANVCFELKQALSPYT